MVEITYCEFCRLYPGRLTEEAFDSFLPSAVAYINVITHNRAGSAEGWKAERVKQAVCAVILAMHAEEAARSESGAKLSSVTNDGYTEVYARAGDTIDEGDGESIRKTARMWLSGTGLVSAL